MNRFPARKRFGQHFLTDRRALRRIVDALDPVAGEAVLEIGPGRGALTAALLERVPRLAAVEVDKGLAGALRDELGERGLLVLEADVLRVELGAVAGLLFPGSPRLPLVLAGNLPYNVSKPIATKLVQERAAIDRAVLMFQLEVAERLVAEPGSRRYGPLGILAGEAFAIEILFELGPGAFRPRPAVRSAVTRWRRRSDGRFSADDERRLRLCLAACFARRRQTLRNNLRARLGDDTADALLDAAGLDGSRRAETIPASDFRRLAGHWDRHAAGRVSRDAL